MLSLIEKIAKTVLVCKPWTRDPLSRNDTGAICLAADNGEEVWSVCGLCAVF